MRSELLLNELDVGHVVEKEKNREDNKKVALSNISYSGFESYMHRSAVFEIKNSIT